MLGRALCLHCPHCGTGHLFRGWFTMLEACPGCGFRFEARPEDAFFLGAFTVNLAVTEGVLLLALFAYIGVTAVSGNSPPLWPVLAGAGGLAVLLPLGFYP